MFFEEALAKWYPKIGFSSLTRKIEEKCFKGA